PGEPFLATVGHTYAAAGQYSLTVQLTGPVPGATGPVVFAVPLVVAANPPASAADRVEGTYFPAAQGADTGEVVVARIFDDRPSAADPLFEYAVTIDWGDDGQSAGTAVRLGTADGVTVFEVRGSHTYADAGVFATTVTATDPDAQTASGAGAV